MISGFPKYRRAEAVSKQKMEGQNRGLKDVIEELIISELEYGNATGLVYQG